MSNISVLLSGASGALGKPLFDELISQKDHLKRIAILTTPERAHKCAESDAKVVVGSLYEARSYEGRSRSYEAVPLWRI